MGSQTLVYQDGDIRPCVSVETDSQRKILRESIEYFQEKHSKRGIQTHTTDYLVDYILENYIVVFIEDQYLLVLDVVEPWYSPKEVLQEVLLRRFSDGPLEISRVYSIMEHLARSLRCSSIEAGTMAAINKHEALARLYHRAGFVTDYIALRKNV